MINTLLDVPGRLNLTIFLIGSYKAKIITCVSDEKQVFNNMDVINIVYDYAFNNFN